MQTVDWLWLIHPALAVVVVYPLLGMVLRLAHQTRQRRVHQNKDPVTVGRDHADLGQWLATAVVVIVLVAEVVVIFTHHDAVPQDRLGQVILMLSGSSGSLAALWRVRRPLQRACFALLAWSGVIGLGLQPEVYRRSDNPLDPLFWQSHFWGGIGLAGLMLLSIAARPEILRQLYWRRWHLVLNILASAIFLAQGISGPRDLLEIPLSWQKPTVFRCDFENLTCPASVLPQQPPG